MKTKGNDLGDTFREGISMYGKLNKDYSPSHFSNEK